MRIVTGKDHRNGIIVTYRARQERLDLERSKAQPSWILADQFLPGSQSSQTLLRSTALGACESDSLVIADGACSELEDLARASRAICSMS